MVKSEICIIRQLFCQFEDYLVLENISDSETNLDIHYYFHSYDNIDMDIDMDVQHFYEMKTKILKHLEILCKEILFEGVKSSVKLISLYKTLEYAYDSQTKIFVFTKTKQLQ